MYCNIVKSIHVCKPVIAGTEEKKDEGTGQGCG